VGTSETGIQLNVSNHGARQPLLKNLKKIAAIELSHSNSNQLKDILTNNDLDIRKAKYLSIRKLTMQLIRFSNSQS